MSFQDKYKEYKEKQEAKKYFRSQNEMFLNTEQWIKSIGGGLLTAIVCGFILGAIIYYLNIISMFLYLMCGYAISYMLCRITGVQCQQVAILSVIMTFICFVIGEMVWMYLPLYEMGIGLQFISMVDWVSGALKNLLLGDLFKTLIALVALFIAYQQAQ